MDKKTWAAQYRAAKRKAFQAERDALKGLPRSLPLQDLEAAQQSLATKTWEEERKLYEGIGKLRVDVRRLGAVVNRAQTSPTPGSMEVVHQKVRAIDGTLKQFKNRCGEAFQQQAQEEEQLSSELALLLQRFEAGIEAQLPRAPAVKRKPARAMSAQRVERREEEGELGRIKDELDSLETRLLEQGGVYCGWSNADHADFLRLRSKHHAKLTVGFIRDVRAVVPDENQDSVRRHFQAYQEFLRLTEQKKQLILRYNTAKREQKRSALEEPASAIKKENRPPRINRCASMGKKETEERLKEWKQQKEAQKLEGLRKREEEQTRTRVAQERRQREMEEKKQALAEYKQRKQLEQQMAEERLPVAPRRKEMSVKEREARERLRAREEEAIRKREERFQAQKVAQAEAELKDALRARAMQQKYAKVGPKLGEATAATQLKRQEKFSGEGRDALTMGGKVLMTTGKAMVGRW